MHQTNDISENLKKSADFFQFFFKLASGTNLTTPEVSGNNRFMLQ